MLDQDPPVMSSGLHGYVRRARERRRGAAALMAAVRAGVTPGAELPTALVLVPGRPDLEYAWRSIRQHCAVDRH